MKGPDLTLFYVAAGPQKKVLSWAIPVIFFVVNAWAAFRHVMWRDEWMPLNAARFSHDAAEWFTEIRYIGRWAFFGLIWLIEQCGGHPWLFKLFIVGVSSFGAYIVCRYAPFTWLQKALLVFGYYPLYEYGTILRDYSLIWTIAIGCCALLASRSWRPLAFGLALAALFQTNPFGLGLGCAFGATYVFDMWRAGRFSDGTLRRPDVLCGAAVAAVSFAIAFKTMTPPPEIAEIVLGQPLRTDSHLVRLKESLPFPVRGWLPIPLFGTWNSQFLDPWPWLQTALVFVIATLVITGLRVEPTALFLFGIGMLGLGAILCHLPWVALRYHGPYYLILVCSYWILESRVGGDTKSKAWLPLGRWMHANRGPMFTGLLFVHVVVAMIFLAEEQVVPFSGSRQAADIIRENEPPDVLIVGDPDYAMISLAGYLDRPVFIASRSEPGAFTRVDKRRRGMPLSPQELSAVVSDCLAKEKRDIVLVTSYPVTIPPEIGVTVGTTRGMTDEHYFIYRIRNRRGMAE